MTVMLALRQMTSEGHLRTVERVGTFVAAALPHLNHYALVFWNDPSAPQEQQFWSRYYIALTQAALRLQREGCELQIYHGIDHHVDSEDRQRLLRRIETHRLAGIIFTNSPYLVEGSPILDTPGIPRVTLASESPYPQVHCLTHDGAGWLDKAVDYLTSSGRRRLALMAFQLDEKHEQEITMHLQRRGLAIPSYWRQLVNPRDPLAAQRCAELLLRGEAGTRPDGLLIMDDNLIEGAVAGLHAAGVRVPQDVAVVAHANFPLASRTVSPLRLLGYDSLTALRVAIDLIDRERRGETVPHVTCLPAVFEEETRPGNRDGATASRGSATEETLYRRQDAVLPDTTGATAPQPREMHV
jgi:DNA-binding LacI/PurR family transcriptional regulator